MTAEFLVFGIAASVFIKALVNVLKELGLSGKWPILAAIGLGILLAAGMQLANTSPVFATWFKVVITGIVSGLTACELYSAEKVRGVKQVGQR